ncbi:MAG TPA: bifunctional UDP-N-acetylglucosamine diphosphorylase/glucosamine-1-phosphate N-acetyltransferase GlmU [Gammaproteobacteria bacterium]|nr:bifunctional UDP-N-acetylglucosamine diphosphorylase/glucosamine-1-phosphate N-acetyltransferase GlmU [Gammaproteobacteria bacterium]
MPLSVVILAAGQGTRMMSSRPKVVHELAGKPILQHVVASSRELQPDQIILVVGHGAAQVREAMAQQPVTFVEQAQQLGTGHALQQCLEVIDVGNDVLVLVGDVPLIRGETLAQLVKQRGAAAVTVLSFIPQNPHGYGRIVRAADGGVCAIVEQKDTSRAQAEITECNSGILLLGGAGLRELVMALDNTNAQGEYYLTDVVAIAAAQGETVSAIVCEDANEVNGINNQQQLAQVETLYRQRAASALMAQGVKLYDPTRIDVRGELTVGHDVEIDINCIFEGEVSLGDNVRIGANCVIRNTRIDAGSEIKPMTSIEDAIIGRKVSIGPFARIRPGTECADEVRIGNFVETKQARIGQGSKVNHLSYIGDTEMGSGVNIGAGTITCNYDGANKFKTIIEDGVFVGSDTQLVAPVRVARNATIGAGSTITKDVAADRLTLSRAKQVTIDGWSRPKKQTGET